MEKTDATSMVAKIKDIILRLGLNGEEFQDQCYYGCSTMMRKKKGVATEIERTSSLLLCPHIAMTISLTWHVSIG